MLNFYTWNGNTRVVYKQLPLPEGWTEMNRNEKARARRRAERENLTRTLLEWGLNDYNKARENMQTAKENFGINSVEYRRAYNEIYWAQRWIAKALFGLKEYPEMV